jgi:hypothetical protein
MDFESSKPKARTIFEEAESEFSRVFLKGNCEVEQREMLVFCKEYYGAMGDLLTKPYIERARMHEKHRAIHDLAGEKGASSD